MLRTVETCFYTFRQNNSGGYWKNDQEKGIGHYVIVEAIDTGDATSRAEKIGLYFDGEGDCSCCGNRWNDYLGDDDGYNTPTIYSQPPEKMFEDSYYRDSLIYIHYFDGSFVQVKKED